MELEQARLLTVEQARLLDQKALTVGLSGQMLMENAGRGCATWILTHLHPLSALILCGTGNNGGDGLVIARYLSAAGVPTSVTILGDPTRLSEDARVNFERLKGTTVQSKPWQTDLFQMPPDCLVDAVFGTGYRVARLLPAAFTDINKWLALSAGTKAVPKIVAIDLPSGLDADGGEADPATLVADYTLTLVAPKAGMYSANGRRYCGEIETIDIGVPKGIVEAVTRPGWGG